MPKYWLPWLVGMPAETSLAICCMIFSGVFDRFPKLRVAFAHGGGAFPFTIGRIEHAFHVRPDLVAVDNKTNPRSYLAHTDEGGVVTPARFYVDSLVHDAGALQMLLHLFGARARRARLGLSFSARRSAARRADRIRSREFLAATTEQALAGRDGAGVSRVSSGAARGGRDGECAARAGSFRRRLRRPGRSLPGAA